MRRAAGWALIITLIGLAVPAYFGNALLFAFYLAALGNAVAFHWWYACSRCSNACCTFNVRSPDFIMRFRPVVIVDECEREFSNLRSLVAGIPLVLSVVIGVVAAWLFSPLAVAIWGVIFAGVGFWYWKVTCIGCGNDCPANRNARYLAWRMEAGKDLESSG
ncbi:MAG: hypothetical protein Q8S43_06775 [Actinomycetota bacterium]|nr:MAG: hypothetical protein FD171_1745 [Actinomycetota bacterium]MDO8948953.1 hypothetical protein [Actinomycetota bacterium]MDP3630638.1 hypothetical protein [Actinomycetota bacterium]MDZ4235447.1 hypothetical protein [Dietzia sp.]TPW10253.1 MAG: hypothetical protein FD127_3823 [Acidimicrobiaceae bacterium]